MSLKEKYARLILLYSYIFTIAVFEVLLSLINKKLNVLLLHDSLRFLYTASIPSSYVYIFLVQTRYVSRLGLIIIVFSIARRWCTLLWYVPWTKINCKNKLSAGSWLVNCSHNAIFWLVVGAGGNAIVFASQRWCT